MQPQGPSLATRATWLLAGGLVSGGLLGCRESAPRAPPPRPTAPTAAAPTAPSAPEPLEPGGMTAEEWSKIASLGGLGLPPRDPSNRYADDARAARLGKKLYFDKGLSGVGTHVDVLQRPTVHGRAPKGRPVELSCATCHDPRTAGVSAAALSAEGLAVGAGLYDVTIQSTVNAAFFPQLYWNGRSDSLWSQAVAVIESPVSMAGNRLEIAWRIATRYRGEYEAIFTEDPLPRSGHEPWSLPRAGRPGAIPGCQRDDPREPFGDAFDCLPEADRTGVTRVLVNVAKAIAAYEARLVSTGSDFDTFVAEGPRSTRISEAAKRGARLFVGKGRCIECHVSPLLSDRQFHNIGVPPNPAAPNEADCPRGGVCDCTTGQNCTPWGALDGARKLAASRFRRDSEWSDDRRSLAPSDASTTPPSVLRGAYRTPSLRDVALTAPYMHNGVYTTLDEVLRHYAYGGRLTTNPVVGEVSEKLHIVAFGRREEVEIIAFLRTLTGKPLGDDLTRPE